MTADESDAAVISVEDLTDDFDRVRVTPCKPTSTRSHTHIARVYDEVEPDIFAETDVSLSEYDAVRALVSRACDVPPHRICFERDSVRPDPV
jgi:hypothetical protein